MTVLIGLCGAVLLAAVTAIAVVRARIVVIRVIGPSMAPTLRQGDRLLVRRRPETVPQAGDIVVLAEPGPCRPGRSPRRADLIVKRVVAVPGDPMPAFLPEWERAATGVVPPGHVVLLGDNLPMSRDSRHFGQVRVDRLVGVAVRRLGGADPTLAAPRWPVRAP